MLRKLMIAGLVVSFGLTLVVWVSAEDAGPPRKTWSDRWGQFKQNLSAKPTAEPDSPAAMPLPERPLRRTAVSPPTPARPLPSTTTASEPTGDSSALTSRRRAVLDATETEPSYPDVESSVPALPRTVPGTSQEPSAGPASEMSAPGLKSETGAAPKRGMNSLQNKIRAAQTGAGDEGLQAARPRVLARPNYQPPPTTTNNTKPGVPDASTPSVATPAPQPAVVKIPAIPRVEPTEKPETIITTPGAESSSRRSVLVNRNRDKDPVATPAVTVELPAASSTPPWVGEPKQTVSAPPATTDPSVIPGAPPIVTPPGAPALSEPRNVAPPVGPIQKPLPPTGATSRRPLVNDKPTELTMVIDGPGELPFGQTAVYKLTLTNRGNTDAERVTIYLLPMDAKDQGASNSIGKVPAGETKAVEIELTARQTGSIVIRAQAVAANANRAEARHEVKVNQEDALQVTVLGPETQQVGAPAAYTVRVANHGQATLAGVRISASLPTGARLLSASGDAQMSPDESQINWTPATIRGGAELTYDLKCRLHTPGLAAVTAHVTAAGRTSSGSAKTTVEGIADLKLEVIDPVGPLAVGEEAVYEIHLKNRGTKAAEKIYIDGLFSRGVEPLAAQGLTYEIKNGAVHFDELPTLGPGKELVITIKAVADRPGAHLFRVETECQSLEGKYAQETTTRFQGEAAAAALEARHPSGPAKAAGEPTPAIQR